jgi:hypothetical protein
MFRSVRKWYRGRKTRVSGSFRDGMTAKLATDAKYQIVTLAYTTVRQSLCQ